MEVILTAAEKFKELIKDQPTVRLQILLTKAYKLGQKSKKDEIQHN